MKKLLLVAALVASFTLTSCESKEEKLERLGKEYAELVKEGKTEEAQKLQKESEELTKEVFEEKMKEAADKLGK